MSLFESEFQAIWVQRKAAVLGRLSSAKSGLSLGAIFTLISKISDALVRFLGKNAKGFEAFRKLGGLL